MNDKPSSPLSIVVIILAVGGIVAAFAIPRFWQEYMTPHVERDIQRVAMALETYYMDNASYPPAVDKDGNPIILSGKAEHCSMGYIPWMLTTPVEHLKKIPFDPYGPSKPKDWSRTFPYATQGLAFWILTSRGPDGDVDLKVADYVFQASGDFDRYINQQGFGSTITGLKSTYGTLEIIKRDPTLGPDGDGDIVRTGP